MKIVLSLAAIIVIIIIGYKIIDNYNHSYIPTFTDQQMEEICIEEGI